jgi:hypothetical protein
MEGIYLDNDEDWSKAMNHNYITLIRKEETHTKIPINYIPLYSPGLEDDGLRFDRNFKQNIDKKILHLHFKHYLLIHQD